MAVAVAARDSEIAAMQRHVRELEEALGRALQEAAEAQEESLDLREELVHLEAALRESEAKRCCTLSIKITFFLTRVWESQCT